jgi:hypothetical protein
MAKTSKLERLALLKCPRYATKNTLGMNDMFIKLVCDIHVLMEMFQTNRICKRFFKASFEHLFIVMV